MVAGVAGRARLSQPHRRQRHSACGILHADFRLHPTIQHLRLQKKPHRSDGWRWIGEREERTPKVTDPPFAVACRVDLEVVLLRAWRSHLTLCPSLTWQGGTKGGKKIVSLSLSRLQKAPMWTLTGCSCHAATYVSNGAQGTVCRRTPP